MNGMKEGGSRA